MKKTDVETEGMSEDADKTNTIDAHLLTGGAPWARRTGTPR